MNKLRVMFICTGNTCRSPMAEVYFRNLCIQNSLHQILVVSAGLSAIEGCSASKMAQTTIEVAGLSLANFKSTIVDDGAVRQASIVVGMTNEHARDIICLFPHSQNKTYTLLSFLGSSRDIQDPYGGSEGTFRECFDRMKPGLDALVDHVASMLTT